MNDKNDIYEGEVLPSSKDNFDLNQNNSNISYSLANENNTSFNEDNNIYPKTKKDQNYLYGNDFSIIDKPSIIGSTRICLYIKGYPIISIGKNILFPLLVCLIICIIYIVIYNYFFIYSGTFLQKMFNYIFLIYIISHSLAIIINPGIPSFKYHKNIINKLKEHKLNELDCTRCNICNLSYKLKDKIGHCYSCNICYYEYDHHCIWIGHCIGKYNKYFFFGFIFSSMTFIMICLTMVFIKILKLFFIQEDIH